MKIAFHCNQLGLRGTEVAMFSYAKYNEEILGNKSIILFKDPTIWNHSHPLAIKKFKDRFNVYQYKNFNEVENYLDKEEVDIFYAQKGGAYDGVVSHNRKSIIHMVFQQYQPHGNVYAAISKWLGDKYRIPYVPYIIELPNIDDNLRNELNIPSNAIVFGRYGGVETFNISFVQNIIKEKIKNRKDIYFLFMNTNKFVDHPQVIYLEGSQDLEYKVKFINSCDAMLHARIVGETFGAAIGEFSIRNKPVITFGGPQRESAHLQMLGDKALKYFNQYDLSKLIDQFKPEPNKDWNAYKEYNPKNVMEKFKKVFLDAN